MKYFILNRILTLGNIHYKGLQQHSVSHILEIKFHSKIKYDFLEKSQVLGSIYKVYKEELVMGESEAHTLLQLAPKGFLH